MIHFVTAYDPATHANLSAIRSVLLESDLVGGQATRAGLLRALATRPGEPLFAMTHGQPHVLVAHQGEAGLVAGDAAIVGTRAVFAWACHTAMTLGYTMSRFGATWWGYTGKIAAPGDGVREIPIFEDVFLEIRSRFAVEAEHLMAQIRTICEQAEYRLDHIEAGSDSYLCLLHIWDRLRVWQPGASDAWAHPDARPPTWMV